MPESKTNPLACWLVPEWRCRTIDVRVISFHPVGLVRKRHVRWRLTRHPTDRVCTSLDSSAHVGINTVADCDLEMFTNPASPDLAPSKFNLFLKYQHTRADIPEPIEPSSSRSMTWAVPIRSSSQAEPSFQRSRAESPVTIRAMGHSSIAKLRAKSSRARAEPRRGEPSFKS